MIVYKFDYYYYYLLIIIIFFKPSLDIFLQWGLKLLFHWPLANMIPKKLKNDTRIQNLVQSSVCAVCSQQTVMQDSIEALHQNQDPILLVHKMTIIIFYPR